MCGITGYLHFRDQSPDPDLLRKMCATIEHRGPDSRGVHISGPVGLGIQRLRVIDLETGDQPIYNEDRSIVVVLNGEIYNYQTLRERLRERGHRLATAGDTEVLVHLYEDEGLDCVQWLEGMFAFALWDERRKRLLLARDRVGKKPLFYSVSAGQLTFGSELPALLQNPVIPRDIDYTALDCFLAYQYVPAPLSAFKAIRKLPPASTMVVEAGKCSISRYWELDYSHKRTITDVDAVHEEIRGSLLRATKKRMLADVPLGAFLSGGIDSSAIVAAMARQSSEPIKTFSIGFAYQSFNELPYARQVASAYGTDHSEFIVEPDLTDLLPRIVRHYGEPFADSSAIPSFCVSRETRRHVTVALNGDGGDESFGGYNRYVANMLSGRLGRLPPPLLRPIAMLGDSLLRSSDMASTRSRARRMIAVWGMEPPDRYARYMSYFDAARRGQAYTPEFAARIDHAFAPALIRDAWAATSGQAIVDKLMEIDIRTYLPGDLLVKMDVATMAYSLEGRSPFLDQEIMELAAALPASLKIRGRQKKIVLRDALRPWLTADILDRPKMGFAVPMAHWLRTDLRTYLADVLFDPVTEKRGYFHSDVIRQYYDSHVQGRMDHSLRLWALLMLELWHREFVAG